MTLASRWKTISAVLAILLLQACGGSSEPDPAIAPPEPAFTATQADLDDALN